MPENSQEKKEETKKTHHEDDLIHYLDVEVDLSKYY